MYLVNVPVIFVFTRIQWRILGVGQGAHIIVAHFITANVIIYNCLIWMIRPFVILIAFGSRTVCDINKLYIGWWFQEVCQSRNTCVVSRNHEFS
jgi:hypothetical protein